MAKTIVLKLEVQDGEVVILNQHLEETEQNFRDVQASAAGTANKLEEVGKNGGAIATLDRLTGGAASQMRDLFESTKLFNLSLKGTRAALIATGVGAFVVALGAIVAYWEEIEGFILNTNKALETRLGILEKQAGLLTSELAVLEAQEKLLKEEGKSNTEILQAKKDIVEAQILVNQSQIDILKTQLESEKVSKEELSTWQKIELQFKKTLLGAEAYAAGLAKIKAENAGIIIDIEQRIADAEARGILLKAQLLGIGRNAGAGTTDTTEPSAQGAQSTGEGTAEFEDRLSQNAILRELTDEKILIEEGYTKNLAQQTAIREGLAMAEAHAREQAAYAISDALLNASRVIGEETAAGKALAIASAAISIPLAAQKAYEATVGIPVVGPVLAPINAGLAIAAGLKNIQQIRSVKVPNVGGQGGSQSGINFAGGGGAIPQPSFNVVGDTGINQLNDTIGQQLNEPVRAYVVTADIEKGQSLENNAIREATV